MAKNGIQKIEFISSGFQEILKSEGTQQVIQETTDAIYRNAVANYTGSSDNANAEVGIKADVKLKPSRWVGFVSTTDNRAAAAEAEDKVLTRALS